MPSRRVTQRGKCALSIATIIKLTVAASVAVVPAAAPAQSIFDTFKNLKNTVRQLGGAKQQDAPAASPPADRAAAEASAPATEGAPAQPQLVPDLAFSEDQSDTQLTTTTLAKGRVQSFDILGFRLGMSPREVARVAGKRGVHRGVVGPSFSGSFELEATGIANVQLNKPIIKRSRSYLETAFGESDRGEQFIFTFTLEPGGPKLSRLNYEARLNGQTPEQVHSALIAKYGPLTDSYRWCSDGCGMLGARTAPFMTMNIFNSKLTLTLDAGQRYSDNARRVLEARAQQIAAKRGDGVRF